MRDLENPGQQDQIINDAIKGLIGEPSNTNRIPILMFVMNSNPNNLWPGDGHQNSAINNAFTNVRETISSSPDYETLSARMNPGGKQDYATAKKNIKDAVGGKLGPLDNDAKRDLLRANIALEVDYPDTPSEFPHTTPDKMKKCQQAGEIFFNLQFEGKPDVKEVVAQLENLSMWVKEPPPTPLGKRFREAGGPSVEGEKDSRKPPRAEGVGQ